MASFLASKASVFENSETLKYDIWAKFYITCFTLQTYIQTDMQTDIQTDIHTDRQTYRQEDKSYVIKKNITYQNFLNVWGFFE